VGTKYVVESDGEMVRRYVELPGGKKIKLATRKAVPCACADRVNIVPEAVTDGVDEGFDAVKLVAEKL
jgi:hypothetical protein